MRFSIKKTCFWTIQRNKGYLHECENHYMLTYLRPEAWHDIMRLDVWSNIQTHLGPSSTKLSKFRVSLLMNAQLTISTLQEMGGRHRQKSKWSGIQRIGKSHEIPNHLHPAAICHNRATTAVSSWGVPLDDKLIATETHTHTHTWSFHCLHGESDD